MSDNGYDDDEEEDFYDNESLVSNDSGFDAYLREDGMEINRMDGAIDTEYEQEDALNSDEVAPTLYEGVDFDDIEDNEEVKTSSPEKGQRKDKSNKYRTFPILTDYELASIIGELSTLIEKGEVVPQEVVSLTKGDTSDRLARSWFANRKKYPIPIKIEREVGKSLQIIDPNKFMTTDEVCKYSDMEYFLNNFYQV